MTDRAGVGLIALVVNVRTIAAILVLYGTTLFILICDAMLWGLAKFLTAKRCEKWTKEMDYVYLTVGSSGRIFLRRSSLRQRLSSESSKREQRSVNGTSLRTVPNSSPAPPATVTIATTPNCRPFHRLL
jgi:hypothetical protein